MANHQDIVSFESDGPVLDAYGEIGAALGHLIKAVEKAAAAKSGNYVADRDVEPRHVTFANGRVVRVVGDGYLVVERRDG